MQCISRGGSERCRCKAYGIPEADLRTAAAGLGIVGITEGGERYIALPEYAERLEYWAKDCATVVDYHRRKEELERDGDPVPFDDDLPVFTE